MLLDTLTKYNKITKILHWFRVIFLIALIASAKIDNITVHQTLGFIFFILMIVSILWRIVNPYPYSLKINLVERNIQIGILLLIYFLLFIMPMIGYLASQYPINLGFFPIPALYQYSWVSSFVSSNLFLCILLFNEFLHTEIIMMVLYILIGVHVFMVLFNQFVRKNNNLKDMT